MMIEKTYFLGVDLGQSKDPTALAVIERIVTTDLNCRDGVTFQHPQTVSLALRYLERPKLATPYPDLVARIAAVSLAPPLAQNCEVVLDATGVGRPVVDMLRAEQLGGKLVPVVIIPGEKQSFGEGGYWRVPKRDLVTALAIALQKREIHIADGMPLTSVLLSEMLNFKMKITAAANDTYEAWRSGQHDDLVLAVALAVWRARRKSGHYRGPNSLDDALMGVGAPWHIPGSS